MAGKMEGSERTRQARCEMREQEPEMAAKQDGLPFEMTTPDGTPLNIATTALIKSLRRGNELEALYWAQQMEARYHKYLWRRLLIFASEDVNIGNPHAVTQVRALADNYEQVKKESRNPVVDRSIITMAVMVLARSEKSREADDLLNVIEHLRDQFGWAAPLRDEVFDLHTEQGKRRWPRKARFRHWFEAASKEENRVGQRDWHLWLLRWAAQRGIYTVESIERIADRWQKEGLLRYGRDGVRNAMIDWTNVQPEFEEMPPHDLQLDEDDLFPTSDNWTWTCSACGTVLTACEPGLADQCCPECEHNPPVLGD